MMYVRSCCLAFQGDSPDGVHVASLLARADGCHGKPPERMDAPDERLDMPRVDSRNGHRGWNQDDVRAGRCEAFHIIQPHDVICSLIQHERREADGTVALVILTHVAPEKSLRAALAELATLSINQSPVKLMRIEDI